MLLTQSGLELLETLGRQKDIASLLASFHTLTRSFGMNGFSVGDPSPKVKGELKRWDGIWPAGWYSRYASQNYFFIDPVVAELNRTVTPFRWSSARSDYDDKALRILHESAEFGMQKGLAIPVHGPRGVIAAVNLNTDRYELSPGDEQALHLASLYLYARMVAIRAGEKAVPVRGLAARECECLSWVASGKTDWEISQILGISEQTVHGYVQNALRKLNARTRAQAVALALQSRQILP